jgi:hypothetical protein
MPTFIVHFAGDPVKRFQGRVSHVSSGQARRFASAAELLSFFEGAGAAVGLAGDELPDEPASADVRRATAGDGKDAG